MTPTRVKSKKAVEKTPYLPTDSEKKVMDDWAAAPPRVPKLIVKLEADGSYATSNSHPEQTLGILLIMRSLGLTSTAQYSMFVGQALSMTKIEKGEKSMAKEINELLSIVMAQKPRDITESMLCLQMASIHLATTNALATVRNTDHFDAKIEAGNLANKLSRTFTMQMEALSRYRTKGKVQRVSVTHNHKHFTVANVAPGAQAVFGDVQGGGGVVTESSNQPHERARTAQALTLVETIPAPFDLAKTGVEVGSGGDAA